LTKEQLADLQEGFELYDPSRTGQLAIEDLSRVARACGANPTQAEIAAYLDDFEEEFIDFGGFVEFVVQHTHEMTDTDLRKQFRVFDRNNTGKIIAAELRHSLKSVGDALSEDEVNSLFQEVGVDKEGMIDFEEFVKVMSRKS